MERAVLAGDGSAHPNRVGWREQGRLGSFPPLPRRSLLAGRGVASTRKKGCRPARPAGPAGRRKREAYASVGDAGLLAVAGERAVLAHHTIERAGAAGDADGLALDDHAVGALDT